MIETEGKKESGNSVLLERLVLVYHSDCMHHCCFTL